MKETIIPDWVPEIERFSLEGLLGNGNWKGVVKGKLLSDDSLWALKFLNMTPLAEELMASRGQTEEEVLRKETMGGNIPHHQNIAYGFIDHADDGTPFLAERYIPGRSLTDSLSGITTFGQSEIHHVASQLATCLNVYHSKMGGQGMAHGDFKPANMIYTPDQTVVLFDNGCATMAAQQVVGDTGIPVEQIKDMEYILTRPPEWFELRKPDKKTDLWSFGSILYKLFTREYFFEEEFKERKDPYDLMKYLSDNPEIAKATLEQKLQHPSIPKQFKPLFRQVMSPWEERMENATLLPNRVDDAVKKYIRANRFTLGQKISAGAGIAAVALIVGGVLLGVAKKEYDEWQEAIDYSEKARIVRMDMGGIIDPNRKEEYFPYVKWRRTQDACQTEGITDPKTRYAFYCNTRTAYFAFKNAGTGDWAKVGPIIKEWDFRLYQSVNSVFEDKSNPPSWEKEFEEYTKLDAHMNLMLEEGVTDVRTAYAAYWDKVSVYAAIQKQESFDFDDVMKELTYTNPRLYNTLYGIKQHHHDNFHLQLIHDQGDIVEKEWEEAKQEWTKELAKVEGPVAALYKAGR